VDELRESAELIRRGVLWCSRHGVRSSLDRLATWMVDERGPSTRSYAMWSAGRSIPHSPEASIIVSIVVPVRDPEPDHLAALVASVRAQTHRAWELILVDDGSRRPEVRRQLDELAGCDERVILLRRDGAGAETTDDMPSSGISVSTNRGAAIARGEVLVFVDHDDELGTEALGHLAWVFERDPAVDLAYTDEDQITPWGRFAAPVFKPGPSPWLALGFNYVTHVMAIRRGLFEQLGGMRSGFDGAQDHDLLLRAFERARSVVHLPLVGYHWRRTRGSVSSSTTIKPWAFDAGRRAVEDACRRRHLPVVAVTACLPPGVWRLVLATPPTPRAVQVVLHGDSAGRRRWRELLEQSRDLVDVLSVDEGRWPETSRGAALLAVDAALLPTRPVLHELMAWSALPGVLAAAAVGELAGRHLHLGYGIDRSGLAVPIEPGLSTRAVGPGLLAAAPREVAVSGDQLLLTHESLAPYVRRLSGQPVRRHDLLCLALAGAAEGAPALHLSHTGAKLGSRHGRQGHSVLLDASVLWPVLTASLPESFWRGAVDRFCPRHELLTDLGLPAPVGAADVQPGSSSWARQTTV